MVPKLSRYAMPDRSTAATRSNWLVVFRTSTSVDAGIIEKIGSGTFCLKWPFTINGTATCDTLGSIFVSDLLIRNPRRFFKISSHVASYRSRFRRP